MAFLTLQSFCGTWYVPLGYELEGIMLKRLRSAVHTHPFGTTASWEHSRLRYVSQFKGNLEALAAELTQATGRWTLARYSRQEQRAELFCPCERAIAWITVHGEVCLPYAVHVTMLFLPDEHIQELFRKHLRRPHAPPYTRDDMRIHFHAFA